MMKLVPTNMVCFATDSQNALRVCHNERANQNSLPAATLFFENDAYI